MDGGANGNGGAAGKGGRANSAACREDCWTEDETATLIEAWGERYVGLNRGSLRQQHWEEVAAIVNDRHAAGGKRPRRTDVQCKNRIDTIKKKFKQEKAKILSSPPWAELVKWPFFQRVEFLIGPGGSTGPGSGGSAKKKAPAPAAGPGGRGSPPLAVPLPLMFRKTPGEAPPMAQTVGGKKRSFSAVEDPLPPPRRGFPFPGFNGGGGGFPPPAGLNAKAEDAESDSSRSSSEAEAAEEEEEEEEVEELDGFRQLAKAIDKFATMYERVEEAKQKQMFDLEKQRMDFAKALEYQRMQVFVESQMNIQKMNRVRRS